MEINKVQSLEFLPAASGTRRGEASPAPAAQAGDRVHLSAWVQELFDVLQVPESPDRSGRIAELRDQVARGEYAPNPEDVARRFLGR